MNNESDPKLDRWLDDALAKYGDAEPRLGMEARIIARLHEQKPWAALYWRPIGVAGVVAVVVVLAFIFSSHSRKGQSPWIEANLPMVQPKIDVQPTPHPQASVIQPVRHGARTHRNSLQSEVASVARVNPSSELPRQATFPAPVKSDQEKLLLAFVQQAPREAAQIAATQREFDDKGTIARLPQITPISIQPLKIESEDTL